METNWNDWLSHTAHSQHTHRSPYKCKYLLEKESHHGNVRWPVTSVCCHTRYEKTNIISRLVVQRSFSIRNLIRFTIALRAFRRNQNNQRIIVSAHCGAACDSKHNILNNNRVAKQKPRVFDPSTPLIGRDKKKTNCSETEIKFV